jgi:hypothetical protein
LYVSKDSYLGLFINIDADAPISGLSTSGFVSSDGALSDNLLIQTTDGFQDVTIASGVDAPTACQSVAAADFDNDMDIDIYLVCRTPAINLPNILYENLGDGTFLAVSEAGGAEGSSVGRGESVATADYNEDGFMDIFITNGNLLFSAGPHQLFKNVGNSNHWLEIDLEGVISNRDGIGSLLLATAGGTTQLREQSGGMHAYSQNHQRIHFGLAANTVVEHLTVQWPSGIEQEIYNIPADQIFHAVELDIAGYLEPPLTVNFSSNSSGYYQPLSYEWDFDNDGIIDSTTQNPTHTYNNYGTYTVKLTVTDFDGRIYTSMRTDYIMTCDAIRIPGESQEYYSLLQDAYDNANEGDTIQCQDFSFAENLNINRQISVTLEGGWRDCGYTNNTGKTILNGNMTISDGILTIGSGTFEIL